MLATVLSIFLLTVLLFAGLFVIPALMTKRATVEVIKRFHRRKAVRRQDALTQEELGLNPPTFADRMTKPRDYKPYAIHFLKQADIIRTTEDGKMYMDREKLHQQFRCEGEDIKIKIREDRI